jgi:hypothetical protein
LIVKAPKTSVYSRRRNSKALGTNNQQSTPKNMKIIESPQIVDLEEEEPKEKVNMDMVEKQCRCWEREQAPK